MENFQFNLKSELDLFLNEQKNKYPENEILKIDLHCHDYNSDVPDEILGRIINVPETWLESETLISNLKENNVNAITITNHNNSRSCYEMIEKKHDILIGAEFSCMVPDFNIGIHVLAYGFNKEQEKKLLKLRNNIYIFMEYACSQDIPTIWAHPLYHYTSEKTPSINFFEKMTLVFERFEVINGQRDTWQNMLFKVWLDKFNSNLIDELAVKYEIDIKKYCRNPYQKAMSGGSDSHMGLFAGQTGTYLHVPNLKNRLKGNKASELALEAIKLGKMSPYGSHNNSEKLTISFLDYVCQIALNRKDPGLLRILLHKGTVNEKILALFISNAFSELQNHKTTMKFIELFHESFMGKEPKHIKRWFISKNYKSIFDDAVKIAKTKTKNPNLVINEYQTAITSIYDKLNNIIFSKIKEKITRINQEVALEKLDLNKIINKFEIPSDIRTILDINKSNITNINKERISSIDFTELLDGLSFPLLASSLILAANFTSAKVMYNNRAFLNNFSEIVGKFQQKKRLLWLTDTYENNNGVSMVLKLVHEEIKKRDLPIDILVCSNNVVADKNLIVIKPKLSFTLPNINNQNFNIPNFLEIHRLFQNNEYDRVMCSTEGFMGLVAIYLKNAFSVETSFYLHTDWITYFKTNFNIDKPNFNRFRRVIRAYYQSFDKLFVLSTDQQAWLTNREMNISPNKVYTTSHWVNDYFKPLENRKSELFNIQNNDPVMLYAGRLSSEKGVFELIEIYKETQKKIQNIRLVIVGNGPSEKELKKELPEAIFLGWVDNSNLPSIYSSANILILPSKFDTFSCVVLEALSCGLPVIAYNTKGPKDIIINNSSGFLVNSISEIIEKTQMFLSDELMQESFKNEAIQRSKYYNVNKIIENMLHDLNL